MRVFLISLMLALSLSTVQASLAPVVVAKQPLATPQKELGCAPNPQSTLAKELCIQYVFGKDYKMALAVAYAESHLDQSAYHLNRDDYGNVWSKDCGVFQINSYYHADACSMSTMENIEYAYKLYKRDGWTAWAAYNNGSYLQYLD
jgi:hypothetical protein